MRPLCAQNKEGRNKMSNTDYKYCIGAGAPQCLQCKRHRPYTQPNSPECKEWLLPELDCVTNHCWAFDAKGGEWISTENALPPLKTRVLVVNKRPNYRSVRIAKYLGKSNNGTDCWSAQAHASSEIVTHWQPLPQMPNV